MNTATETLDEVLEDIDPILVHRVLKGRDYVQDGIPLKDAMDTWEVDEAICFLARILVADGWEIDG